MASMMMLASAAIRGLIIAPPGAQLVVSDLSNIEGRIVAWLAREEWKLEAFRAYDAGLGPDLYNITATSIIGGDPWKVPKSDRNAYGKVSELACLGPNTLVYTDRGLRRIVEVLLTDRLWDGEQWVNHQGILDQGVRQVVLVDGITVTPDHLIKTGATWTPAGQLVTSESTLSLALETGSENLPSPGLSSAQRGVFDPSKYAVPAARRSTTPTRRTSGSGAVRAVVAALEKLRTCGLKSTTATRTFSQTKGTEPVSSIESLLRSTAAAIRQILRGRITAAGGYAFTNRGYPTGRIFCATSLGSMGGTFLNWSWIGSTWTAITRRATCGLSAGKKTDATNGACGSCSSESQNWKNVYDIALAGPNNRFTIASSSGFLLVHNCGYGGGVGAFQTFAKAYQIKMAPNWPRLQDTLGRFAEEAQDSWSRWGHEQAGDLPAEEWLASETVKLAWRARHPATVQLWEDLQNAAIEAIRAPGSVHRVGLLTIKVGTKAGRTWLMTKLPSGRYVTYYDPKIEKRGWSYMGVDTKQGSPTNGQWIRLFNYGGRQLEQATQGTARDVLFDAMPLVEADGFNIVMHVHDELVCEASLGRTASELSAILSAGHAWTGGLPLAAAGFECFRYRKDG